MNTQEKEVCAKIGHFFLIKNEYNYQKTEAEILRLGITSVVVDGDAVTITSCRPGLVIGTKGKVILALVESLQMKVLIKEDEHQLLQHLIPYDITIDESY